MAIIVVKAIAATVSIAAPPVSTGLVVIGSSVKKPLLHTALL